MIAGDNTLMTELGKAGYTLTMVENGWHLSSCAIDRCIPPPVLDEQLAIVASQVSIGVAAGISGDDALAIGARHVREWMLEHAEEIDDNGELDAVVLHLLAPHPPLRWSAECREESDSYIRSGLAVALPGTPAAIREERIELYYQQKRCVDETIRELVTKLSASSAIAVVGDHGPDTLGQFGTAGARWTDEMIEERNLTLAALRLPAPCDAQVEATVQLTHRIMACLAGKEVVSGELRSFIPDLDDSASDGGVLEVRAEMVGHLLRVGAQSAAARP